MKRLRQWLFNFAAAVSLLLCLTSIGLGIYNYSYLDGYLFSPGRNRVTCTIGAGNLGIDWLAGAAPGSFGDAMSWSGNHHLMHLKLSTLPVPYSVAPLEHNLLGLGYKQQQVAALDLGNAPHDARLKKICCCAPSDLY